MQPKKQKKDESEVPYLETKRKSFDLKPMLPKRTKVRSLIWKSMRSPQRSKRGGKAQIDAAKATAQDAGPSNPAPQMPAQPPIDPELLLSLIRQLQPSIQSLQQPTPSVPTTPIPTPAQPPVQSLQQPTPTVPTATPAGRIQVANQKMKATVLNFSGTIDPFAWEHEDHIFVVWTEWDPDLLTFHHSVAQPTQLRVDVTQRPPSHAFFQSALPGMVVPQFEDKTSSFIIDLGIPCTVWPPISGLSWLWDGGDGVFEGGRKGRKNVLREQ